MTEEPRPPMHTKGIRDDAARLAEQHLEPQSPGAPEGASVVMEGQRFELRPGVPTLFAIDVGEHTSMADAERIWEYWRGLWLRAGIADAPPLCMLPPGVALAKMEPLQLQQMGLMFIPTGEIAGG